MPSPFPCGASDMTKTSDVLCLNEALLLCSASAQALLCACAQNMPGCCMSAVTHTYTHARINIHTHIHTHTRKCACAGTHVCTHIHEHRHMCTHTLKRAAVSPLTCTLTAASPVAAECLALTSMKTAAKPKGSAVSRATTAS